MGKKKISTKVKKKDSLKKMKKYRKDIKSSKLKRIRKVIILDEQDLQNNSDESNLNQELNKDLPSDDIENAIDIKNKVEEGERSNTSILDDLEKEPDCEEEHKEITQMTVFVADSSGEDYEEVNPRFVKIDSNEYLGVLFLTSSQKVPIKGYGQVAVLCGSCEIYGYKMVGQKNLNFLNWYSPTSSSLLYIKDTSTSIITENGKTNLLKLLKKRSIISKDIGELDLSDVSSCVLFKKLKHCLPYVLKAFNNYNGFSSHDVQVLNSSDKENVYNEIPWHEVLNNISEQKRQWNSDCQCSVMLCGGKDVGKSSFAKFIINDLLARHSAVFYLECDCGQTEFTPPGILSLVKITNPLLGPSFTHSVDLEKSYFYGHISPKEDPNGYIKIITLLYEFYKQNSCSSKCPIIINQQGWARGRT